MSIDQHYFINLALKGKKPGTIHLSVEILPPERAARKKVLYDQFCASWDRLEREVPPPIDCDQLTFDEYADRRMKWEQLNIWPVFTQEQRIEGERQSFVVPEGKYQVGQILAKLPEGAVLESIVDLKKEKSPLIR
ncbi:hypothetical protein HYU14_05855 [Candidatus Woesearchaeota archaeon]|nr:hypothetical protein [Candidatus Woesearchaeota archaeon]